VALHRTMHALPTSSPAGSLGKQTGIALRDGLGYLRAVASERLRCNAAWKVVPKPKTQSRDGTTRQVKSSPEFTQRLALLVPRPHSPAYRQHVKRAA
jgi:hypothetical protein